MDVEPLCKSWDSNRGPKEEKLVVLTLDLLSSLLSYSFPGRQGHSSIPEFGREMRVADLSSSPYVLLAIPIVVMVSRTTAALLQRGQEMLH